MATRSSPYETTFRRARDAGSARTRAAASPRPEVQPAALRGRRARRPPLVLVADDVAEMRTLLVQALQAAGYRTGECRDGWDLLKQLKSYVLPMPREETVDLVISDIRMPGLTGLEVLEGTECSADFPPVILITAFGDEQTHRLAVAGGAAAILDKPFDIDELVRTAQRIVPLA
jgi:CheY-like chemotaxis protein